MNRKWPTGSKRTCQPSTPRSNRVLIMNVLNMNMRLMLSTPSLTHQPPCSWMQEMPEPFQDLPLCCCLIDFFQGLWHDVTINCFVTIKMCLVVPGQSGSAPAPRTTPAVLPEVQKNQPASSVIVQYLKGITKRSSKLAEPGLYTCYSVNCVTWFSSLHMCAWSLLAPSGIVNHHVLC